MSAQLRALLVVPANNTTMEPEMNALCPALAPFAVARVRRPPRTLTVADLPAYLASTLEAVAPFLDRQPEVIVYGCTAAGFLGGPAGNARVVAALHARSGAPVVSTAAAMVDVLCHDGVSEVAVVTPYLAEVNDGLRAYLDSAGIAVATLESFYCATTEALGQITAAEVRAKALASVTPATRAVFIACSQLPTLEVVPELRCRLGVPVWSSIAATAWAVSRVLSMQAA